jgi:hypothetical protein
VAGLRPSASYRCRVAERSGDLWASFQHDPRDPSAAPLRASDADRNVVHAILTEAFADGRLDRGEYDDRATATLQARTLGQLPPLVADLVPARPLLPANLPLAAASSGEIQQRAEGTWRKERREALLQLAGSAVLFGVIAIFISWWALVIPLMALVRTIRTVASKDEIVASEVKRLERKQAKELEARAKKKQTGP